MKQINISRQYVVSIVLRLSLAFGFIYAAIAGFFHPFDWIGYFPAFLRDNFPDTVILNLFGLSEIIIGAWLVWGKRIFIPSIVASLYLLGIILFNFDQFNVLFRDVPILGIAIALSILNYPRIVGNNKF